MNEIVFRRTELILFDQADATSRNFKDCIKVIKPAVTITYSLDRGIKVFTGTIQGSAKNKKLNQLQLETKY